LATLKRKLERAQEANDKPIPQDLIRKFKIPRIDNIKFIDTVNAEYRRRSHTDLRDRNSIEKYLDSDPSDHPLNLVFSHTSTQFVTIILYFTTKGLPGHLLPYLQIYCDSFFSLPFDRDGVVPYEQVVRELGRIAVDYSASLGVDDITEVLTIKIRAEKSKYERVVRFLSDLLVQSIFDSDRYH
jgi:Zn-dependent M16 (insulinase) family peptidase